MATLLACTLASAAHAQVPADIAERLRALGAVVNAADTARLYGALHAPEPYQNIEVSRDIRYGVADRHLLDVFAAGTHSGPALRPVLMFVHGGGFTAGNKRLRDSPYYDNILVWAARKGMVGVNVTYRLAPLNPWPAAAQDVGSAVRWVIENIAGYGGDPQRVFLMGHSAGATHVASYVAGSVPYGPAGRGLAGALLLSGQYRITEEESGPQTRAYFGTETALFADRSPLNGLALARLPLFVSHAELDPGFFQKQALLLQQNLCDAGHCPTFVRLAQHNHLSQLYSINTDDRMLTDAIAEFVTRSR